MNKQYPASPRPPSLPCGPAGVRPSLPVRSVPSETHLNPRRTTMSRTFKIAIIAAFASFALLPAAAAQTGIENVSVRVAYGDLDMSSMRGAQNSAETDRGRSAQSLQGHDQTQSAETAFGLRMSARQSRIGRRPAEHHHADCGVEQESALVSPAFLSLTAAERQTGRRPYAASGPHLGAADHPSSATCRGRTPCQRPSFFYPYSSARDRLVWANARSDPPSRMSGSICGFNRSTQQFR